jgi:DNA modification methylase
MKKEVWSFPFEINTDHPAPFPEKLPDNILHCIVDGEEKLLVLDPFMGSGTVAVSAIKHNCDYIGFEKFQQYVDMSNEKILGNA